jgi:hypothetical protein
MRCSRSLFRGEVRGGSLLGVTLVGALVAFAAACGNPSIDTRIEVLGPEKAGVPPSEFHRPGQPCVLCHSTYEGASPEITVGGTIFATPTETAGVLPTAVEGAIVTLIDAEGDVMPVTSNCAGNFYLTKEQWNPSFPLRVELSYPAPGGTTLKPATPMSSRISRDGSCGSCHDGPPNQGSPGYVFCEEDPMVPFEVPVCVGTAP